MRALFVGFLIFACATPLCAETAIVKYCGTVDLAPFKCDQLNGEFIKRVCYDEPRKFMVIQLNATNYVYCDIDAATVQTLIGLPDKSERGRYYNRSIKGKFGCKEKKVPICK